MVVPGGLDGRLFRIVEAFSAGSVGEPVGQDTRASFEYSGGIVEGDGDGYDSYVDAVHERFAGDSREAVRQSNLEQGVVAAEGVVSELL